MVLSVGNFERSIKSFSVSSRFQSNELKSYLIMECTSVDEADGLAEGLVEALKEEDLTVINGESTYTFDGYMLDSVERFVSDIEDTSRLTINFKK